MDRKNIDKIAITEDDRLLLAKLWDKIHSGMRKNILSHSGFLSPREQQMARFLFGDAQGLCFFGGHADTERNMLVYLPDYLEEACLTEDGSPIVCLHAVFHKTDTPSHRDFLGALMGCGITRECVGDIWVGNSACDFFVAAEIAEYILQNFECAGRTSLKLSIIPLDQASPPDESYIEIRDTVASVRLDSILASGFRISRSLAADYISAGKAAINGLPCEKPDRSVPEEAKLSLRGLGKLRLVQIGRTTKKGRISVIIHRYE